jgi:hypothetical protein
MQLGIGDQHVILADRIVRIHAKRIVDTDLRGVGRAQLPIFAGKAIRPGPLLAEHFDQRGVFRHVDELGPHRQARREHRRDADRCDAGEPPLELFVLGFVVRLVTRTMAVPDDGVGHKQVHRHEHDAGDPESHVDGRIHGVPVGSDRCEPPWAQEMKQHRGHYEHDQRDRHHHRRFPLLQSLKLCFSVGD